jgi:hypothetical protein
MKDLYILHSRISVLSVAALLVSDIHSDIIQSKFFSSLWVHRLCSLENIIVILRYKTWKPIHSSQGYGVMVYSQRIQKYIETALSLYLPSQSLAVQTEVPGRYKECYCAQPKFQTTDGLFM